MDDVRPDADVLQFFDGHRAALGTYLALEARLRERFPVVERRVQKTQISFFARRVFACVSFARVRRKAELPEGYLVVTLGLPAPLDSNRVAVCVEPYPNRWTHHIVVNSPDELDDELLAWIDEAYAFAASK